MPGHAARAVPWGRVVLAAGLVVLLLDLVRRDPWGLWPLQGAAAGLVAGASAWCFDEPLAHLVDTAPRGVTWQSAARACGALLPALAWCLGVVRLGDDGTFGHPGEVLVQGLAAVVVGAGAACWRRARGDATPGLGFAAVVVPVCAAWALVRPFGRHEVVFPYGTTTPVWWQVSGATWGTAGALAALLLAAALAEAPWWRPHARPRFRGRRG